jgi:hypothetical protein
MGIETICVGGYGGSAHVFVQLRNVFPGLGGKVETKQDFVVACRAPKSVSVEDIDESYEDLELSDLKDISVRKSLNLFLRHSLLQKFDDYFFRTEKYRFAHIPRVLGSNRNGVYFYEWVHGMEGFDPQFYDDDLKRFVPVLVDEWSICRSCFDEVGADIFFDIVDTDGYYIKNIITQEPQAFYGVDHLTKLWKRIDFGPESLHINYHKADHFLNQNIDNLKAVIGKNRYKMLRLIVDYAKEPANQINFSRFDELKALVKEYRHATASHMGLQGHIPVRDFSSGKLKKISYKKARDMKPLVFSKKIQENQDSAVFLEIRSGFNSFDKPIYTMQELPVARFVWYKGNPFFSGSELFTKHFLFKKLEDAFISQGRYSNSHIPRPLGAEGNSYYYEWINGRAVCSEKMINRDRPSSEDEGIDDWYEFCRYFFEAGIDMKSGMEYRTSKDYPDVKFSNQIIVSEPVNVPTPLHISRMWKRVGFDETKTFIDFSKLDKYLTAEKSCLESNLSSGRYETMLLAVKYLRNDISNQEFARFRSLILDYRTSTLRHLNYNGFGAPPYDAEDIGVITK